MSADWSEHVQLRIVTSPLSRDGKVPFLECRVLSSFYLCCFFR